MSRKKNRKFKESLASDLRGLADVLIDSQLIRDKSPLLAAADMCTGSSLNHEEWRYDCLGLIFIVNVNHLNYYRKIIPGKVREILIELSITAKGFCIERSNYYADPFLALAVSCKIEGRKKNGPPFFCAWHFDRIAGDTEEESRHFAHPCYHFQVGGNHFPQDHSYGRLLLLESPRIAHPPLDAILAIDFVLSNYFPVTWHDLRQNVKYARIVQAAQLRCWRPYAEATTRGKGWGLIDSSWQAKDIWPQLVLVD